MDMNDWILPYEPGIVFQMKPTNKINEDLSKTYVSITETYTSSIQTPKTDNENETSSSR
jgi:hypothetical protein